MTFKEIVDGRADDDGRWPITITPLKAQVSYRSHQKSGADPQTESQYGLQKIVRTQKFHLQQDNCKDIYLKGCWSYSDYKMSIIKYRQGR